MSDKTSWRKASGGCELSVQWWRGERKVSLAVRRCWLQCQLVGGGPTCLWLSPSPSSLLWRKRQMESEGSGLVPALLLQAVHLSPTLARRHHARGTWGLHRSTALHDHKGQLLTERGRPAASLSRKHSAASLWMWATTASSLWSPGWVKTCLYADETCPLKVSQAMPALKLSRVGASCRLVFHWAIHTESEGDVTN